MKTHTELRTEIKVAFGSVPFPSHQGLRGSMAMDRYAEGEEVASVTSDQDIHGEWWQIPRKELRDCQLGLSYLDEHGVLFYLPAYLDMALDDVGKERLAVLDLLDVARGKDDARHRAYLEKRLSRLTPAQRRVTVSVLEYLLSQLRPDDPATEYERSGIRSVLDDEFWARWAR